jgi:deoxyribose-phosphate aldolase
MTNHDLPAAIEATLLKPVHSPSEVLDMCKLVQDNKLALAMVWPDQVEFIRNHYKDIRLGTVIGFPMGRACLASKQSEILEVSPFVQDVDFVMNYNALVRGDANLVSDELNSLSQWAHGLNLVIKCIVETCYLNPEQQLQALALCEEAKIDFIKTSTGFGPKGAQAEDIRRWAQNRRTSIGIKASGGVRTQAQALEMLNAGASRIGASAIKDILNPAPAIETPGY